MPWRLELRAFRVPVHLGVSERERAVAQDIEVSAEMEFSSLPRACESDDIGDTICYAQLCELIKATCTKQSYRLIEKMAFDVRAELLKVLPKGTFIRLRLHKIHAPVQNLLGGALFEISS